MFVQCCQAKPTPPRLFKRVARARRVVEGKRLENLKKFHEALVETSKGETKFIQDLLSNRSDVWKEATADDLDIDEE
jgi:hypothetical protein